MLLTMHPALPFAEQPLQEVGRPNTLSVRFRESKRRQAEGLLQTRRHALHRLGGLSTDRHVHVFAANIDEGHFRIQQRASVCSWYSLSGSESPRINPNRFMGREEFKKEQEALQEPATSSPT
jgi:hypothetical protein